MAEHASIVGKRCGWDKARRGRNQAKASARGRRTAIVTGGASGIGLACVERLVAAGWQVGMLDRDAKALAKARKALPRNVAVRTAQADVTDEKAIEAIVTDMAAAFGRLDGVVNSAGIAADVHVFDTLGRAVSARCSTSILSAPSSSGGRSRAP